MGSSETDRKACIIIIVILDMIRSHFGSSLCWTSVPQRQPFVTPGSTDDGNEENGIRRLMEQLLSTLPEDKRAMVRAAMGLEEVVQIAPRQISLKELSAERAPVEKRQEDMAKRIIDTEEIGVFHEKSLSMEKCKITAELAEYKPTVVETMEVEQAPLENLTEDQKNFWMEKQAEANVAKRALQELATHSTTKRRCTTKTQPPEEIDVEPPDDTQGDSQASQVGKLAPPDINNLIAHADSTAVLGKEAASRAFREEAEEQTAKT